MEEYYDPQYLGKSRNPDLIPIMVDISKEAILYSFTVALHDCCDRSFMSYKMVGTFTDMMLPIFERLELVAEKRGQERAREIGEEMLRQLREIDTNDDVFPEYTMEYICEICGIEYVSPYE